MSGTDEKGPDGRGKKTAASDPLLDDFWNEAVEEASAALQSDDTDDEGPPPPPPDAEVAAVLAASAGEFEPLADPLGDDTAFEDIVIDDIVIDDISDDGQDKIFDGIVVEEEIIEGGEIIDGEILDGEILEGEVVEDQAEAPVAPPGPPPDEDAKPAETAQAVAPPTSEESGRSPLTYVLVLAALGVVAFGAWKLTQNKEDPQPKPPDRVVQRDDPGAFVEPTDTKPVDTKPVDTKPEDTKPEDTKPEDTKPEDTKPEDTKPEDAQPEDTQPEDTKPVDTKPEDPKPADEGLGALVKTGVIVGRSKNVAGAGAKEVQAAFRSSMVSALRGSRYKVGREGAYIRPYLTAYQESGSGARVRCSARVQLSKKATEYERFKAKARSAGADAEALADDCAAALIKAIKAQLPPK